MDKRKTILSLLITGTIGLYFIYQQSGKKLEIVTISNTSPKIIISTNFTKTRFKKNMQHNIYIEASNSMPTKMASEYKNGTYVGRMEDAYYGEIQVAAIIQSGKIENVKFLSYPQNRGNSRIINNYAMPYLRAEAIQAQSANVDTISGATFSSGAFRKSLSSALIKAKA